MPKSKHQIQRSIDRAKEKERLTNMFMINMLWAIAGEIILYIVLTLYQNGSIVAMMSNIMAGAAVVFIAGAGVLLFLAKKKDMSAQAGKFKLIGFLCSFVAFLAAAANFVWVLLAGAVTAVGTPQQIMTSTVQNILWGLVVVALIVASVFILKMKRDGAAVYAMRMRDYAVFLWLCAVCAIFIDHYYKIYQTLTGVLPGWMSVSYWGIYVLMIAIPVYLVVGFVVYLFRIKKVK